MYDSQDISDEIRAMSLDQLKAEQNRYREAYGMPTSWNPRDILTGMREAFVASVAGRPLDIDAHPVAMEARRAGPVGAITLARKIAAALDYPMPRDGSANEICALSMVSDQFPNAIQEAASATLAARPSPLLADVRAVTADVRVKNYQPQALGFVDIDMDMPTVSRSGLTPYAIIAPRLSAQNIATVSKPWKLIIPEQTLMSDEPTFLTSSVTAIAAGAARAESRRVAELLEANTLPDGEDLFAAGNANVGTAAVNAAGLGAAFALLREQPTESGVASGLPCSAIVCRPGDELDLLALIETLPADRRPRVVVNAFLSSADYWYALADPMISPAIARVLMHEATDDGINIIFGGLAMWVDAAGKTHSTPGISLEVVHTVAIQPVSAVGIVRLSKT